MRIIIKVSEQVFMPDAAAVVSLLHESCVLITWLFPLEDNTHYFSQRQKNGKDGLHHMCDLLSSGRRYRSLKSRITKYWNGFILKVSNNLN